MSVPIASDFVISEPGSPILANPSLPWLLTTNTLLGTIPPRFAFPDGNLNDMFWKLLQNDGAIVNFIHQFFSRTFGVIATTAHVVNVVPAPLTTAPAAPANGAVHTINYTNFEVTYNFNATTGLWSEVARLARITQVAAINRKKLTIPLGIGDEEVPFTIPTTDDNNVAFAFTMDDLSLIYINNVGVNTPIVSVYPGYNVSGAVVRIVLSSEIAVDANYQLIAIFRRTTLSA